MSEEIKQSNYIDFHIHSNLSENGRLNEKEIYEFAEKNGLCAIAITDYHTFTNSIKLQKLAHDKGDKIKTVIGAELCVKCKFGDINKGTFHLICLGVDVNSDAFKDLKTAIYKKIRSSEFTNFLASEAIDLIHKAGGIAIIAHPSARCLRNYQMGDEGKADLIQIRKLIKHQKYSELYDFDNIYVRKILARLEDTIINGDLKGVDGIEIPYPAFIKDGKLSEKEKLDYYFRDLFYEGVLKIAEKHNLLVSAGSDFHSFSITNKIPGYVAEQQPIEYANVLERLLPEVNKELKAKYNIKDEKVLIGNVSLDAYKKAKDSGENMLLDNLTQTI